MTSLSALGRISDEPHCDVCPALGRRARGTRVGGSRSGSDQAVIVSVDTAVTAVRIRSATAFGCESAIECEASTSIGCLLGEAIDNPAPHAALATAV